MQYTYSILYNPVEYLVGVPNERNDANSGPVGDSHSRPVDISNEGDDFSDPRMNRRRDRVAIGVTIGGDFQRSAVAWLLTRRSSCSESTECRLDFPFVRHTAAFSLVERLQLLG